MNSQNVFVFVVCGADEHINTLNFSLKSLRKYSQNDILVITDTSRNTAKIDHEQVLDVRTPAELDNHQASIFLKTGIYKYVDDSKNYCYLDSDVIALSHEVDDIFSYFQAPVTFAPDHCKLNYFSPSAVNCSCAGRTKKDREIFIRTVLEIIPEYNHDGFFKSAEGRELYRILLNIRGNPFKRLRMIFFNTLIRFFGMNRNIGKKWGSGFRYSWSKKAWMNIDDQVIIYNLLPFSKLIKAKCGFTFNRRIMDWVNESGEGIFTFSCDHLTESIRKKFDIYINDFQFQHWNGGVFLFNKSSFEFLDVWHRLTMEVFSDDYWKTRDQGTLVATVWKFNLQQKKLLPREFNFIADYFNPQISYRDSFGFTPDNFKTAIEPKFIHVYHHFGNKNWEIWQGVEKYTSQSN